MSIRIPEDGPFGDTFFEASTRAIVAALLVKSLGGGCVESVFTFATHRLPLRLAAWPRLLFFVLRFTEASLCSARSGKNLDILGAKLRVCVSLLSVARLHDRRNSPGREESGQIPRLTNETA